MRPAASCRKCSSDEGTRAVEVRDVEASPATRGERSLLRGGSPPDEQAPVARAAKAWAAVVECGAVGEHAESARRAEVDSDGVTERGGNDGDAGETDDC